MTVLADPDRVAIWQQFMTTALAEPLGVTKADLRAAVDAIDAWCDANAGSFNAAIPQPARGALTAKQKALLLTFVAQMRAARA